jgi:hypothetical protein
MSLKWLVTISCEVVVSDKDFWPSSDGEHHMRVNFRKEFDTPLPPVVGGKFKAGHARVTVKEVEIDFSNPGYRVYASIEHEEIFAVLQERVRRTLVTRGELLHWTVWEGKGAQRLLELLKVGESQTADGWSVEASDSGILYA